MKTLACNALLARYKRYAPSTLKKIRVPKNTTSYASCFYTYNQLVKNLVIVPVNGNKYPYTEDALRTQLNKIYGQAVVKWNISFASNLDVPGIDPFDDGGSGLLSNYSPDMRKVVNAYKANLKANIYYLFLVKNPKSGTDGTVSIAGFMPRSKECGFIFVDKNGSEEAIIRTMAHELGHGAFSLPHTFREQKNTLPEKGTDNLMDYANGTKLFKYQWDRMRYPEIVIGLFEDDDAGAMVATKKSKLVVTVSDTTMTEGKVFIHAGTSKQIKVKFEFSDTSEKKIPYQLIVLVESTGKTLNYPKSGYDTLIYNQIKAITLDSLPQGKYALTCKAGKDEYKRIFFIRKRKLEVTKEQLKAVFTSTDTETLAKVSKTINTYGDAFGIATKERMTQFLAQTGYESGGFKDPKGENGCYSSANTDGWHIWFTKTWAEPPFGTSCDTTLNAIVRSSKKLKWTALACDSAAKKCVKVPNEYVCSSTNSIKGDALTKKLFSYVYQCEGGNGNSATEDGYKYRGHGAIQLTWKKAYQAFDTWLKINYKVKYKDVVANPQIIDDDKELFILSAMWFWSTNGINTTADSESVKKVTLKVNSKGLEWEKREKIYNQLKNEIK